MPYSANGIGTGLVAASRKRKNEGLTQFDAIEAGMFLYLPFLPYKALHVLDIRPDAKEMDCEQYQFVPLRLSTRLVLKAFLNRWGNVLGCFGAFVLCIAGWATATMERPFARGDRIFLTVFSAMLAAGVVCKLVWFLMSRRDEKIKDLIGPHGQGFSDPRDWKPAEAEAAAQAILENEKLPSLVEVARRAIQTGDRANAAFCLRLAMRDPQSFEAQDLFERLLND
jgi:hypothetical protein